MKEATLGQRLHALRKYRGLSLQELARMTGISRSNLNRYERDESKPTTEYLKKLCRYYRVISDYLLFGAEESALEQQGWSRSDPELEGMVRQLARFMSSSSRTEGAGRSCRSGRSYTKADKRHAFAVQNRSRSRRFR